MAPAMALAQALTARHNKMPLIVRRLIHQGSNCIVGFSALKQPIEQARGELPDGLLKEMPSILRDMDQQGVPLDSETYASLLQLCANTKDLEEGKRIHAHILVHGIDLSLFLGNKLLSMYAKSGSVLDARLVFDKMPSRNIFSWNAMITGYVLHGYCDQALTLYYQMERVGIQPNGFTFPFVLKACSGLAALQQGKDIHDCAIRSGFELNIFVGSALVDMYAKCGDVERARQVFDKMSQRNVVSWTAMIVGYTQNGDWVEALKLFREMQLAGVNPNSVSVVGVLPASANLAPLQQGKEIHAYVVKNEYESDVSVGNALVDMYLKCGNIQLACQLFNNMVQRDVVSWNVMIAGCVQNGCASEALRLFYQMSLEGVKPDSVTITSVLPACSHLTALQKGMDIHAYITRNGFESITSVGNALIDMYAKCGSIPFARQVFDKMFKRDVISWTAIIAGYGMHGHGDDAIALFSQMQHAGMKPNDITFVAVLSACSHAGLVDEGMQYFHLMSCECGITPRLEHYTCMVDLLGRAGHLDEAYGFIQKMPIEPNADVWGALLGACRIHCNVKLGQCVARHLLESKPENAGFYVLISNICAKAGRWEDVANLRIMMKGRGVRKIPACSWIEVENKVHTFLIGDRLHPQSEKIYAMLEGLAGQMEDAGYVPDTTFVLHDIEEGEKECDLSIHSEKLALAF